MRIGLFSETYPPYINGVAVSVYTLFNELKALGHTVYVITTTTGEVGEDNKIRIEDNILRIPGFLLKKLYNYRAPLPFNFQAYNIVKHLDLEIIHVNTEMGIGLFAKIVASRLHLPIVYTYHTMYEDYTHYVLKDHLKYFSKTMVGRLSRFYSESSNEIISPSLKTKNALRKYGIKKYINIIPTGIPLDKYDISKVDNEKVASLKNMYNLNNKFVFLSLGRIAKEKAIDVLILGYKEFLKTANVDSVFLIVGDGPGRKELEELTVSLGLTKQVIFTGFVSMNEVPTYYRLGDVFCSASISETQGLTFIEAMAADLLVLARYDKNLEGTLINGKTGYFFSDSTSFTTMANKLISLSKEELNEMKLTAKEQASKFSAKKFALDIEVVYHRAIRSAW